MPKPVIHMNLIEPSGIEFKLGSIDNHLGLDEDAVCVYNVKQCLNLNYSACQGSGCSKNGETIILNTPLLVS
jgi:hypothetical protein